MIKRVYTLRFERSCPDSADLAVGVFEKLNDARKSGDVVQAAPESIKSLALKFVEHLHAIERLDPDTVRPPGPGSRA